MAMEERKCQMSWSSKNESRIQSLLCSRDSAGVFCVRRDKQHSKPTARYDRIKRFSPYKQKSMILCDCKEDLYSYETVRGRGGFSVRVTDLPGAETLEEEIQCKAPNHSCEENTHQRQTLDSLTTPQLNTDNKKQL